ncbi:MAG: FAD-dependent oxidoreductase [Aestuariivita sp.]|uniref:flavin monoamine oxidase family protein n=1 Tax=Aestuariivita sp. TaxID=1872407 RepID=UPI003BAF9B55
MSASSPRSHVIVIGSGMAGLGAARVLHDAGLRVTVIEARDRIGGRTHTSHLWPDLPMDMGASWIHGTKGNPVTALAKAQGLTITPTSYKRAISFDQDGHPFDFGKAVKRALTLVDAARKRFYDADADLSVQAAVEASPAWQAIPPRDRAALRLAINTRIEHEYSGDWSLLSAWNFDQDKDFPGKEAVVTPGFGAILSDLAKGLDLHLGEPVTAIAPAGAGVSVTTARGTHTADAAIVTLPLGVLQSGQVRFDEALGKRRQRAIDALGMGLLNKCVLRFDRVFWPQDVDWIDYVNPVETLWGDWTSYLRATGQPLLAAFNAARMAETVEAWDDATTAASALEALRAMYGGSVPDPVGYQITRWRRDPFALGSYSFKAVGSSRKDHKALFGPDWDGRLWFAGEATSTNYPATVHGALMTGRQVADAMLLSAIRDQP